MPPAEPQTVTCPHCRESTTATPVNVLVEGNRDVDDLFRGTLNQVVCEECAQTFLFETPLIYRDDATRFLVYFLPGEMSPDLDSVIDKMDDLYAQIFNDLEDTDQPICRLTLRRGRFIEKIALHQNDLDDRIIEYVKYLLFQHNPGLDPVRHDLLFDFGNSDVEQIRFLAFDRDKAEPAYQLDFQMDDYRELEEAMFASPQMQDELEHLFREYYVSVDDLVIES